MSLALVVVGVAVVMVGVGEAVVGVAAAAADPGSAAVTSQVLAESYSCPAPPLSMARMNEPEDERGRSA